MTKKLYTLHFISETYQRSDLQISFQSLLIKPLIHVKPHDFTITYSTHIPPVLLKGEEHLIKNIQRERVLQLFVIDIYIEQVKVNELIAKIIDLEKRNGFIRYNVVGNQPNDYEILKKLLNHK